MNKGGATKEAELGAQSGNKKKRSFREKRALCNLETDF